MCQKKTFVRYLDIETKNYLNHNFGRCDREMKCKYHRKPDTEFLDTEKYIPPTPEPPSFHPYSFVEKSISNNTGNKFVKFLTDTFNEEEVLKAVSSYKIGTTSLLPGSTVFWQIDSKNRVHHGKVMLYEQKTGKRAKNAKGNGIITSVRSILKIKDFTLQQCLFGLHLVNEKTKKVALVESEKTAVIMSIVLPKYTWLSTGSLSGLKYEYLQSIKNIEIVAYPDKGCFDHWKDRAEVLNGLGFKVEVSDSLEKLDAPEGSDVADIFIESKPKNTILASSQIKKYDPTFGIDEYNFCKNIILNEKTDEPRNCLDLDGNRITQAQSNAFVRLLGLEPE